MDMTRFLPVLCCVFGFAWILRGEEAPAPLRIAVVDLTRVFEKHPETAVAVKELTEERDASRERFLELSNRLKEVLQKHQELIRADKQDDAVEVLKKANELEREIASLGTTEKRDLEEKFRKQKHRILSDIRDAVRKFNEARTYDLIFDSSSASSNGLPQVVDAPGATDITGEIIEFLENRDAAGAEAR